MPKKSTRRARGNRTAKPDGGAVAKLVKRAAGMPGLNRQENGKGGWMLKRFLADQRQVIWYGDANYGGPIAAFSAACAEHGRFAKERPRKRSPGRPERGRVVRTTTWKEHADGYLYPHASWCAEMSWHRIMYRVSRAVLKHGEGEARRYATRQLATMRGRVARDLPPKPGVRATPQPSRATA